MPNYTEANFSKADWEKLQLINAEKAAAQAARRQRRLEREAGAAERAAIQDARRLELEPITRAILALSVGQSCDVPTKEWPLAYRLGKAHNRVFKVTTARGYIKARVTRLEPLDFAPPGQGLVSGNEDLA